MFGCVAAFCASAFCASDVNHQMHRHCRWIRGAVVGLLEVKMAKLCGILHAGSGIDVASSSVTVVKTHLQCRSASSDHRIMLSMRPSQTAGLVISRWRHVHTSTASCTSSYSPISHRLGCVHLMQSLWHAMLQRDVPQPQPELTIPTEPSFDDALITPHVPAALGTDLFADEMDIEVSTPTITTNTTAAAFASRISGSGAAGKGVVGRNGGLGKEQDLEPAGPDAKRAGAQTGNGLAGHKGGTGLEKGQEKGQGQKTKPSPKKSPGKESATAKITAAAASGKTAK